MSVVPAVAVVLSTFPNAEAASTAARTLVEERLCACVNIVPGVRSIYVWDGKLCDEQEVLAVIKTTTDRADSLKTRLLAIHPYDVPEVLELDATASPAYLAWVQGAVTT
ncbi:MAG: divalent-cation tolerance protein CutA [Kofleriaceae bacterium]